MHGCFLCVCTDLAIIADLPRESYPSFRRFLGAEFVALAVACEWPQLVKFQFIGIPRVGATLAVALKNRGFAPATKGDRKGRPYACISNSLLNSNLKNCRKKPPWGNHGGSDYRLPSSFSAGSFFWRSFNASAAWRSRSIHFTGVISTCKGVIKKL